MPLTSRSAPLRMRANLAALGQQRALHFLLLACLFSLLAGLLHVGDWSWGALLDRTVLDRYFAVRGARSPGEVAQTLPQTRDIVLVETSHPIPRPLLGRLLHQLRLARVVAFDLMFVDQEAELAPSEKPWYRGEVASWRRETALLAQAAHAAPHSVFSAWPEEKPLSRASETDSSGARGIIWQKPPLVLWQSAGYRAHVQVNDGGAQDGRVRTVRLFQNLSSNPLAPEKTPALGLAVAAASLGISRAQLNRAVISDGFLRLGAQRIPVDAEGNLLIDYVGGRACFDSPENRVNYRDVLSEDFYAPEDFAGKIVIVGESSFKSKEIMDTPFGLMPGVQIHANVVATLLSQNGPPTPLPLGWTLLISCGCSLLLVAPLLRFGLWTSFVMAALQLVLLVLLGCWIFAARHQILAVSVPVMTMFLTLNALALHEYGRARRTLGTFIGQEMVSATLGLLSRPHLGGRVAEATAFFCDLRGYTALSEGLSPQEVTRLINNYTNDLVKIVKRHGGRPIDYQGDGVFVLFEAGAHSDHAARAVRAALELQEVFNGANAEICDGIGLEIGIGLETGPMMIGLVGSQEHMKPGAVGDAVNIASRVQGMTRECGFGVLMTRNTRQRIGDLGDLVPIVACGAFEMKGRQQPIELFALESSRLTPAESDVPERVSV